MSLMQETALIVFARAPQPGRVKSRLAASIGEHAAAEIYARLLGHALALAADWTGPKIIAAADAAAMTYFESLPEAAGFLVIPQIGDELNGHPGYDGTEMKPLPAPTVPGNTDSERMSNALRMVLTVSKADLLKKEARLKLASDKKRKNKAADTN